MAKKVSGREQIMAELEAKRKEVGQLSVTDEPAILAGGIPADDDPKFEDDAESILKTGAGVDLEQAHPWALRGERCRQLRIAAGFGMRQYAERVGILPSLLCDLEHGRSDPTSLEQHWEIGTPLRPCLVVSLPLGDLPNGYLSRHMEITGLTDRQARALRRLVEGAKDEQLVLLNGKRVDSGASLVRYLLEQVPV